MAGIRVPTAAAFWVAIAGVAFLTVAACAADSLSPSALQGRVPDGTWGGVGIRLDVVESETRLEFDCSHATIAPLAMDGDNRFDVVGLLILERGGPVRQGEPERSEPARYSGRLDSETLTMTVTLTSTGESAATFTATRGQAPRLRKCV